MPLALRLLGWAATGAVALLALGLGAALVAPGPVPVGGPEPGRSLYQAHCAQCHGPDGRGRTWRARVFLLRPGDLASREAAALPDAYLADIIRHGGAPLGKPGMPGFGFHLRDDEVLALVAYLRALTSAGGADAPGSSLPAAGRDTTAR